MNYPQMLSSMMVVMIASATSKSILHPLSNDVIYYINSLNTTWKAGRNFPIETSLNYLKSLSGVLKDSKDHRLSPIWHQIPNSIPDQFDARTKWPKCPTIKEIRDQGICGSCWVHGAVEAMSDRICIHSDASKIVHISAQEVLSCCSDCGLGCQSGYPGAAWEYWVEQGLVTGGNYNMSQGCLPYTIPPCEHHVTGNRLLCEDPPPPMPQCFQTCKKDYNISYHEDKHFGARAYFISDDPEQIQTEIMTNGPVEATFTVYSDFWSYKTGIYKHETGYLSGVHGVKLIGWGTENRTPYWMAANSWDTDWGDNGFFKILRGKNECGIEQGITAGLPKV